MRNRVKENPYYTEYELAKLKELKDIDLDEFEMVYYTSKLRMKMIKEYGFAIPDKRAIELCCQLCLNGLLEVGAGTGYWSYEIRKMGGDCIATDKYVEEKKFRFIKEWTEIEELPAIEAIQKYPNRTLLIVWPSYNESWATKALKEFKGDTVIYVGENYGGCTADESFFIEMEKNWEQSECYSIPTWPMVNDFLYVLRRKA